MFRYITILLLASHLTSCAPNAKPPTSAAKKPNILFILTDDQGYADLGAFGSLDLETPHIDSLAAEGIKLTQFYAGAPLCSPSRASLLTGQTPARAGVPSNVSSQSTNDGMPAHEVTIAEALKSNGYKTALIGKWHLGLSSATQPKNQGFDFSFGHLNGCIDNYSHTYYWATPYRHDLYMNGQSIRRDGEYFPDLMVNEAKRFMDVSKNEPFFVYFAMNMPHYPYQGDPDWLAYYEGKALDSPRLEYAAFISTLDDRVGRLIDHLKATGKYDDTIIVFQSDHGYSTESRAMGGGGSAGVYRGAKFSLFEGGIRVPAIVTYPARLPKNVARDAFAVTADWFPTLLDILNIDAKQYSFDGRSILPILEDEKAQSPHNSYAWQWREAEAVRDRNWKLLINPVDTSDSAGAKPMSGAFLYDLSNDPSETNNLAKTEPDRVDKMMLLRDRILLEQNYKELCTSGDKPTEYDMTDKSSMKRILGFGWHDLEKSHVWSKRESELRIPMPDACKGDGCSLVLRGSSLKGSLDHSTLDLNVLLNGEPANYEFKSPTELSIPVSGVCGAVIRITVAGAASPSEAGLGNDVRTLGLSLSEVTFLPL